VNCRAFGLLLATSLLGPVASAEEEDGADHGDTVAASKALPPLKVNLGSPADQAAFDARVKTFEGREYPAIEYLGASWLRLEPKFVHECRDAVEALYRRDYNAAKQKFAAIETAHPGMGVGPVGQILVWQALMLENFDFRYDSQYSLAYKNARSQLGQAMEMAGNDAWETFLSAGILGVDAIHQMRKEQWASALNRGYEAMKLVSRTKELAPEFVDIRLGDGLFAYWAAVVSMSTKAIPDTPDRRATGIQDMIRVQHQGVFLRPAAGLALTYSWIEEGNKDQALAEAQKNQRAYPNNVINNLVLGRVYSYKKMFVEAERTYRSVLATDPNNRRVYYYLGQLYIRWRKLPEANGALDKYLAFKDLSSEERGSALYYKGLVAWRNKDAVAARKYYQEAWTVGKIKRAKARLDKMDAEKPAAGG
jgi:tetratricopeptide (TPR) repeat protein